MANPKNRCLYEILNVSRDASDSEIRSSYRRLALQLHPDKNPNGDPAEFQALQHAYEVLSDPKERQFYDSHRSQILFSSQTSSRSNASVFDLDLFSYFSTTAFSGYGDTGKGFFKVYGDVFGKIYAQELFFVKELGLDEDSVRPAPLIGNLESDYAQVTAFYSYWLGFVTVLDFGWVGEYDASLGANRRSRRLMEEENKKQRKKAKREYVDLVRDLASFAKKRDKRVRDMQVKKSLEEEKRREEEKKRKKEEERRKMEKARMYEEQEWAKIDDEEEGRVFEEMGVVDDDNNGCKGKRKEEFYCVVCNKKFKSDKQWKNHEQSKKHREKVAELRVSFQEEEEEEEEEGAEDGFESVDDEGIVVDEVSEELKDLGLKEDVTEDGDLDKGDEVLSSDDEASVLEAMVSGRKSKKNDYLGPDDDSLTNESISHNNNSQKSRRNRAASRGTDADIEAELLREEPSGVSRKVEFEHKNEEENAREQKDGEIRTEGQDVEKPKEEPSASFEGVAAKGKGSQAAGKKNKKQQTDAKGPAKKEINTSKTSSKGRKQKGSTKASSNNACDTCGESFDTRNKLFAHLGYTGHAALKSR